MFVVGHRFGDVRRGTREMKAAGTKVDAVATSWFRFGDFVATAFVAFLATTNPLLVDSASANPEVRLEWISKGGDAITPPNDTVVVTEADIAAETELVLRISLVLDEVELHEFGFLLLFDEDLMDELDIPAASEPTEPSGYGPFEAIGFFNFFESDSEFPGEIGSYRGCVTGSVCDQEPESFGGTPVGSQTIVIDEVTFVPTAFASNDRRDITISDVLFNEEFRDASGELIDVADVTLGHASVVPEPAGALLTASAIATLAGLARRRSRSVAQ
jgi:hypothetical protein